MGVFISSISSQPITISKKMITTKLKTYQAIPEKYIFADSSISFQDIEKISQVWEPLILAEIKISKILLHTIFWI